MIPVSAAATLQTIIAAVSSGSYEAAIAHANASRLSSADLARVAASAAETFAAPPFPEWDVVKINGSASVGWSVRAPLYNPDRQCLSDWELHFTVNMLGNTPHIEIDDFLVP